MFGYGKMSGSAIAAVSALALVTAPLDAQRRPRIPKWKIDPFTENDPKLLQLDAAQTFADISSLDEPRLGLAVGAGVRYVLPVGPLSLDFACSVLERPTIERCGWHLQLGYAF